MKSVNVNMKIFARLVLMAIFVYASLIYLMGSCYITEVDPSLEEIAKINVTEARESYYYKNETESFDGFVLIRRSNSGEYVANYSDNVQVFWTKSDEINMASEGFSYQGVTLWVENPPKHGYFIDVLNGKEILIMW